MCVVRGRLVPPMAGGIFDQPEHQIFRKPSLGEKRMDEMLKGRFVFGWKVIIYLFLAGIGGGAAAVGAAFYLIHPEVEVIIRAVGGFWSAPCFARVPSSLYRPWTSAEPHFERSQGRTRRGSQGESLILTIFILLGAIYFWLWIWPFHGLKECFLISHRAERSVWHLWSTDGDLYGFSFRHDPLHSFLVDADPSSPLSRLGCLYRRLCPGSGPCPFGGHR